ncbi:RNA polymerase sigma factor [Streptomyces chartreusis]|uniref:RNA polymerase sigma factor n=1 Tax=Streptomyces chartreusis TaxID=1969 RepID=UPI00378CBF16
MNENVHAGSGGDPTGVDTHLPLNFQALYLADQDAFHDYAYTALGSDEAAEDAVHTAMLLVLRHWEQLLVESNMQQQVWAILREVVDEFRRDREDRAAITKSLAEYRQGLVRLDGEQGVFDALATLPPQQFDAVVLRYILRYKPQRISWYMGIHERTVDYHCRQGKQRIERSVPTLLKQDGAGRKRDRHEKDARG